MTARTERRKQYHKSDPSGSIDQPAHRRRGWSFCCGKRTQRARDGSRHCQVCKAEYVVLSPDRAWAI